MTFTIDFNYPVNTGSSAQGNIDPNCSLHEISQNIPTLLPKATGLGSTHHVTIGAISENELKLKESFERAKRDAAQNGGRTSEFIQEYGITDQNMLFEIAKIAAAQNGRRTSDLIQKYGITDQSMLFEIAKIAAAQSGIGTSWYIRNYGITDQNRLFEIAKIAAAQKGEGISGDIRNYGITDQKMLFEIAKIAAAQNGWYASVFIQDYGITDQKMLFEIAKIAAAQDGRGTSLNIKQYGLSIGEQLPILQICLAQMASVLGASNKVLAALEETIFTKHTSLQQQLTDLLWLGKWMRHYLGDPMILDLTKDLPKKSSFCDEEMIPLLNCILKTIDPNLRNLATIALLKGEKDPEKITSLKNFMRELGDERLYLIVLFSTIAGIETEMTRKICGELPKAKYKDSKLMAPINELMGALYESRSLSLKEKQKLLGLIFNPPVKGNRESRPDFNARLDHYRKNRQNWITAVHSLLYFGQEEILKNITNTTELVGQWKAFMGKTFYIRDDLVDKFFPIFGGSKRYPNGLIIYASRLQTLPKEERDLLMPLLGKFANSVLDGTFPQMRYSFIDNPHLKTVFSGRKELLKKWQTSLPIKIESTTQVSVGDKTPLEQIQKLMRDALENHHLGADQDTKYPELNEILAGNFKDSNEEIVRHCATILNPKIELPELKSALIELQKFFPSADVQFHHDLKDMMTKLEAPTSSVPFTIEDTDDWEDLVMMGTEVDGSCQNINRDPALNKCLLASLLDGKIRLMVAREKGSGKIIGRVVLRVDNPVLFVERLYTRNGVNGKLIRQNILEGCRQKAQSMGFALAASAKDYSNLHAPKYPGILKSLGGPAPYEYVDALSGIAKGGIYSIPESYLLWTPAT